VVHTKEVKLRPSTDVHDLETKLKHIKRFLEEGNKAKITVRFRGREMAHRELGEEVLKKISRDHYEFESIHPFFDGNGRVGRIIMNTQLLSQGYPPAIIEIEDRYKYYLALSRGDMGDFKNLTQMVCDSVIKGYNLLFAE